jgi:2-succinyl-5-enolpyruvyl-6-hydroxy-3-cyclohexene-1-carboxylate synthase
MTGGSVENTLWARSFVDELVRSGLRDVIVAPGSRSTPLVMACAAEPRISTRVHLDERSAGFFALGVGKATRRPAAVITTSGTAVANLFPAVIEASQSGVPLLVLSADRPHRLRGADANQAIDQVAIFGGYPREFFEVGPPAEDERALRHLRALASRAFYASVGHDAGPVHVNFPFDKPLEPAESTERFDTAFPLAATGRAADQPFIRIAAGRPAATPSQLGAVAEVIRGSGGVIIAGPSEEAERLGPAVTRLGAVTGYPILADPLSGARYGPDHGAHVVAGYDLFLRDEGVRARLAPTVILRVGASPTSAALQRWIFQHDGVPHIVIDDGPRWKDHGTTATTYLRADPVDTLGRLVERVLAGSQADRDNRDDQSDWDEQAERGAGDAWRSAEAAALATLGEIPQSEAEAQEGMIAAAVLDALPEGANLVISSSMPIRDLDALGMPREESVHVLGNRGASGIDGVVSTAYGIASKRAGPTVCVIGDLAFFHDQNGLLWSREADAPVVFVLIDNDGGGIFRMLPISEHDPEFTDFFTTPHGLDPRHAAAAHSIDYSEPGVGSIGTAVVGSLASGRSAILRVRTDSQASHARRTEIQAAVTRSVVEALG